MRIALPALIITGSLLLAPAFAKLPAPTPEAAAKAAETAAKNAWTDKVGLYQLCQSMNRTAEHYRKTAGASAPPPVETPACADPGAYAPPAAPASAPPLEASGAHSPPGMAVSPPSSKATAAEQQGQQKK